MQKVKARWPTWVLWMEEGGPRTGPEDREVGMRRATEGHDTRGKQAVWGWGDVELRAWNCKS